MTTNDDATFRGMTLEQVYLDRLRTTNRQEAARRLAVQLDEALIALVAVAEKLGLDNEPAVREAKRVHALAQKTRKTWRRFIPWAALAAASSSTTEGGAHALAR